MSNMSCYKTKLETLLENNNRSLNRINETHYSILYNLYKNKDSEVSFDLLKDNDNKLVYETQGNFVIMEKIVENQNSLVYKVTFSEGSTVLRHHHPDCDEVIKNKSESNFRIELGKGIDKRVLLLKPEGLLYIYKDTSHQVSCLNGEGELEISFIRK